MAAPDTKIIWDDQTTINNVDGINQYDGLDRPVLMTVFSSDQGPEKIQKNLTSKEFFELYGSQPNYFKHGQALIQAANIANAGGLQYCKRVVAKDSKLAHFALIANVQKTQIQKTNKMGKAIYKTTAVDETYWKKKEETDVPGKYKLEVDTDVVDDKAWEESSVVDLTGIKDYKKDKVAEYKIGDKVKISNKTGKTVVYIAKIAAKPLFKTEVKINVPEYDKAKGYNPDEYVIVKSTDGNAYYCSVRNIEANKPEMVPGAKTEVETTDPKSGTKSNAPVMIDAADIKYYGVHLDSNDQENTKFNDIDQVFKDVTAKMKAKADTLVANADPDRKDGKNFLLFTITENGRGVSTKRLNFFADNSSHRPVPYIKYVVTISQGYELLDTKLFTLDPFIVEASDAASALENKSIEQVLKSSKNVFCKFYEDNWGAFIDEVSKGSGINPKVLIHEDILFGYDTYGRKLNGVVINEEGLNLNPINGIRMEGGDNGEFGDAPIKLAPRPNATGEEDGKEHLTPLDEEILKVFNGSYSDDIYDLDNTQINAIFDANYKTPIKDAIAELASFREDCFFFRDFGIGNSDLETINSTYKTIRGSRFAANYINSYDTIEPYYRKQITVTVPYHLCAKFVHHYMNGVGRPFCGQAYGITFNDEIIPGTLNFSPKRTPKTDKNLLTYDQKQYFDDRRLNYIAYYNGIPTMDTEYTSQTKYSQLSWLNNVLTIQKIIHEIRAYCPKSRYTFLDGQDLITYKNDIQTILNRHKNKFKSITVEYAEDERYSSNKIFYAIIKVKFRDFIQSEVFKITAID